MPNKCLEKYYSLIYQCIARACQICRAKRLIVIARRYADLIGRGAQRGRIFVVDDERTIASSVAAILQLHGFSARFFLDPLEALDAARCEAPDLLISDVSMPQLSGVDLAIRIQEQCPACKIMLFSGQAATADLLKVAREQGYDFRLLAKPVHPSDLLSELSKPRTLPNLTQNCQSQ
jgi:DNA-binding NtrC family response regulator